MCVFNKKEVMLENRRAFRSMKVDFFLDSSRVRAIVGPHQGYLFSPRKKSYTSNRVPSLSNENGFFAFRNRQSVPDIYGYDNTIIAIVELSGKAVRGTYYDYSGPIGWRAHKMKILGLEVVVSNCLWCTDAWTDEGYEKLNVKELASKLQKLYPKIPVKVVKK